MLPAEKKIYKANNYQSSVVGIAWLRSCTTYWRMRVERAHSLQSTEHNHLFLFIYKLKLVSPATSPNKIPLHHRKIKRIYGVLLNKSHRWAFIFKRKKKLKYHASSSPIEYLHLRQQNLCSQKVENRYDTWLEKWPEFVPIVLYTK